MPFCIDALGQLYPCPEEQQNASSTPVTELLPTPAANSGSSGSSHDQTVLVETGYNQMSFHMGTICIGVGATLAILAVGLSCYCLCRKTYKNMTRVGNPHHYNMHHRPTAPQARDNDNMFNMPRI